jgi:hypothetical protein
VYCSNRSQRVKPKTEASKLHTTFNLLVTGHTSRRMGGDGGVLESLSVTLDAIRGVLNESAFDGR